MEYKEIQCEHCGEKMQIPSDRDEILCMFCGKKNILTMQNFNGKTFQKEIFLSKLSSAFLNVEAYFDEFKKDTYGDKFKEYYDQNLEFFYQIKLAIEEGESSQNVVIDEILSYVVREKESRKNKNMKERMQYSMNMYMATRFMPAIVKTASEPGRNFCQRLCKEWATTFKNSDIKVASFEEVAGGFKNKLCYITTAACEMLGLGDDCYELNTLRNYRDGYLSETTHGKELVETYYNIAPTIVKRIEKEENKREKYQSIWEEYLQPCIALIEAGKNEMCKNIYVNMVNTLYEEYMEDSNE